MLTLRLPCSMRLVSAFSIRSSFLCYGFCGLGILTVDCITSSICNRKQCSSLLGKLLHHTTHNLYHNNYQCITIKLSIKVQNDVAY